MQMYDIMKKRGKGERFMKLNAEKLKCYRKRTGLSSQEFAFICDMPVGTYFSYESGQRNPKYENLKIIADKLNVSIDDLTSNDEDYIPDVKKKRKSERDISKERVVLDRFLLRSRRKQLNIKAEYIAKRVGISVSRYREYEKGYGNPTRKMAREMCNVLNLKFYELVVEK